MKLNLQVDVHHLTRVEGHGNIVVRVEDGVLREARWDVVETPRYFEVMLKGKHYSSAGLITARICGICSIGHCLASVRATEDAFGIEIPSLARKLRLLAKHGETLQSHALHLFFLAAPDFVGTPSALPLLETHPAVVDIARRLKGLGNRICDAVAGRTTHPVSIKVGGMAMRPSREALRAIRPQLVRSLDDLDETAKLFKTFNIPDFVRETEFVSLQALDEYPWIGGGLISSDGVRHEERDYAAMTNEYVTDDNTSKWCRLSREAMAVGALARVNNSFDWLRPEAKAAAKAFGLVPVCHNPFMNNVAQLVECVHVVHESIRYLDEIVNAPDDMPICADVTPRAGAGVGAVEVPRGILYHHYEYDDAGRVVRADCVIPTTQNNANIHLDMNALVRQFAVQGMTDQKLELLCSMLVRAYDPCISCSVH
ncbi:MAG: Ni/Fe hydrogenase subunit alpha [Polyangiaceae bacterium]|jgi:coenzyme F420-reducing hydrogenase alpha subunit|nr:Ni/Fe hydrogenase subunit alpha [Polyangiaceae bacterium]